MIVRAVGSLLALAVLVVGVPVFLVAVVGWPLPAAWPDWAMVWRDLRQLNIDSDWVIGGLAVAAWVMWAQVIWALLFELANMARAGRGVVARPAPLTFPGVATVMARLVAGVVSVTLLTSSPSSAGAVGSGRDLALELPVDDPVEPITVHTAPATGASQEIGNERRNTVVVGDGETAWDVAVRVLGDGRLVADLLDHNEVSALDVEPGMELALPPGVSAAASEVTVVAGDHLWGLSARRLQQVGVDSPSNAQIAAHVEHVVAANQPAIDDPDVIHPGEVFTLPPLGERSEEVAATEGDVEPTAPRPRPPEAGPVSADPPPTESPDPVAGDATEAESGAGGDAVDPVDAPPVDGDTGERADNDLAVGLVAVSGIGLITAAVGAIVARNQAQLLGRRRPGTNPRFAVPDSADRLITETSDDKALDDVDRALRHLGLRRRSGGFSLPELVGVLIHTDAVRLLLASPATGAPEPFTVERDGMVWAIARPVVGLDVHEAPNPYPTLIPVGYTDTAQLLVDLEYVGTLSLNGSFADVVDEMATIALQLATSPLADTIEVVCVGFGEELADLERVVVVPSIDTSRTTIEEHASAARRLVAATGNRGPDGRADGIGDWTPMVVLDPLSEVVNDSSSLLAAVRATPSAGVTAVLNSVDSAELSFELHDDRLAIPTYQIDLRRRPLNRAERTGLSAAVVAAREPHGSAQPDLLSAIVSSSGQQLDDGPQAELPDLADEADLAAPVDGADGADGHDYEYRVRLLGPLRVEDRSGEAVRFARSATPEFLAYLTRHRHGVEVGHVMTTLWPATTARRTWIANVYADAARSLAAGGERGVSLTPRPGADDEYRLSPAVTSDLDQVQALVSRAVRGSLDTAVEHLTEALAMVEGVPFSNITSRWPIAEGHWQDATVMVDEAARCLATLALDRLDDPRLADWAAARGLLASPHSVELHRLRLRAAIALDGDRDGDSERDSTGAGLSPDAVFQHYQAVVMADDHRPEATSRLDPDLVELYESYRRSRPEVVEAVEPAAREHQLR